LGATVMVGGKFSSNSTMPQKTWSSSECNALLFPGADQKKSVNNCNWYSMPLSPAR
jgi:hypothetical protein